ncbi:putative bifunctional diguanylate cyclase/phosphodiesterase [Aquipuribacter nitratireducens]|uniref:Bifunctional diguanylate cyclase/phosphodiesterase n=1 Tax=Aquipuribacter nitratireducens TaxID=650104 RepID=A0ABW0GLN1_9MICO
MPPHASAPSGVSQREMGRALGWLYVAGATLAVLWSLLPHPGDAGDPVVLAMAACAAALGAALAAGAADRASERAIHCVLVVIQVVITVAFVAVGMAGGADNDIRLFYLWATPFAAFFFSPRGALRHSAWTVLCLTVALAGLPVDPGTKLRVWLTTVGALAAVGLLVGTAAARVRAALARLQHTAWHDGLSGLANRGLFARRLEEALTARDRDGGSVHVLLVDLDRFKHVNDTYGHHAGDAVVVAVSGRLAERFRRTVTVARMGGDEFALVARSPYGARPRTADPHLTAVLARLADVWREPVVLPGGDVLRLSATVGVASASGPGADAGTLLRDADVALYRAKQDARGSVRMFDADLRVAVERRVSVDRELAGAMERGELDVVYQPVVDLGDGRTRHAEALVRWTSPVLGAVSPAEFVPIAEDNGLVVAIGRFVLDRAMADLARWRAAGVVDDDFGVAVNVSARQLEPCFVDTVTGLLARHGLPADRVHLEVTESVLVEDTARADAVLTALRALGSRVALDDFGTGWSSLSYLQRFPLDTLKVDRSFVAELDGDRSRPGLVAAVVDLARSLGMDVVAEGVETPLQAQRLRAMGVRWGQGWLFARPLPEAALVAHLAAGPAAVVAVPVPPPRVAT